MSNEANQPSRSKNVEFQKVKDYFIQTLTTELDARQIPAYKRREEALVLLGDIYQKTNIPLGETFRQQIFRDVIDHLFGFGPIQPLLDDDSISEVMVNGCNDVYVERAGILIKTKVTFENDEQIIKVIERIIFPLGRRIDYDNPSVDARLPDGSRVNAIIPPVAIDGPSITIRKFTRDKLRPEQLIEYGSITEKMVEFLRACVVAKLNIVISGGTGSGKTTLLNVLSGFIPEKERIVTIEDAAELQLQQEHIVRLETKPANSEGVGKVSVRDLVRNSLRMRPDRIVVGEVRGGEAIDMLQAMNTGHDGSLTTLHANTPRDALSRLETMSMMSGLDIPLHIIREQISSAVDVIVQQSRLDDGSRKVTQISEVAGMEGQTIVMTDVFKFEKTGVDDSGKTLGELKPTGIRPLFSARLEKAGLKLGPEVFGVVLSRDENRRHSSRRRR
jgi:pilus assembly protein CpaF